VGSFEARTAGQTSQLQWVDRDLSSGLSFCKAFLGALHVSGQHIAAADCMHASRSVLDDLFAYQLYFFSSLDTLLQRWPGMMVGQVVLHSRRVSSPFVRQCAKRNAFSICHSLNHIHFVRHSFLIAHCAHFVPKRCLCGSAVRFSTVTENLDDKTSALSHEEFVSPHKNPPTLAICSQRPNPAHSTSPT
jgi:hypothetical protein